MKAVAIPLLLALLPGLPAAVAAETPAPATEKAPANAKPPVASSPYAARFQQVQERIAALFSHRNETPPPPDPLHNPFRTPGSAQATPVRPTDSDPGAKPADSSVRPDPAVGPGSGLALLQQAAATLKVTGIIEIEERAHLIINARAYKAGDLVKTQVSGEAVYIRVKEIDKRSVTLSLDDAEMTLKF